MGERWTETPPHDECIATWGHVWETLRAAALCALLGHRGLNYPSTFGRGRARWCWRCSRRWERCGPPAVETLGGGGGER